MFFIDYFVISDIMLFENIANSVYSKFNTRVMQHMLAVIEFMLMLLLQENHEIILIIYIY